VGRVGDVAAKHHHFALLHLLRAGDQRQQRRFADAVGSDHADHAALRNVEREAVKRERRAIAMVTSLIDTTGASTAAAGDSRDNKASINKLSGASRPQYQSLRGFRAAPIRSSVAPQPPNDAGQTAESFSFT